MENKEIKKRLSKIKNLPALPVVVNNVIKLTQNPDSTAFEIAEAIAQDQSLASKVLKTANSAYYGFPRKITTINYAIVVLGLSNIKNIVLSTSIMKQFPMSASDSFFDLKDFWKHSLLCGIISKKISSHMGIKNTDEIFMCGLLHDFGKLILYNYLYDEFVHAIEMSLEQNIALKDAEAKVFGFDHSGIGGLLLKKWSFPPAMVSAVEHHHTPDERPNAFRIASIVHVADYLCKRIGIGNSGDNILPELNKKAYKLTQLNSKEIKEMSSQITKEFKAATGFLYEGE